MFNTHRKLSILMIPLVLVVLILSVLPTSGYLSVNITRDVELLMTEGIAVPTAIATSGGGGDDVGNSNGIDDGKSNGSNPTQPTEPTPTQRQFIPQVTTTSPPPAPSPNFPQLPTAATLTVSPLLTPTLAPTLTPTPLQHPRIIITNINNVNINNVQNFEGTVRGTPDCAPLAATVMLGPSTMEDGGARILATFDPCVLNDGTVLLNLPDEQGIQLAAANMQGGQTTQSAIIPLQRIAPVTQGDVLFGADLNEQITGPDQVWGDRATLNGNINALFLLNNTGKVVEFEDHSLTLDTILRR